jgi:hypothetical protein
MNNLQYLLDGLKTAKAAELTAKTERLRLEELIEKQFIKPADGEGTHNDEGFKIVWKLNRTVDTQAVQNAWEHLGPNSQKAFRWKAEVDLAQLRALQSLDPEAYKQVAEYITTKPAKPSIELKD